MPDQGCCHPLINMPNKKELFNTLPPADPGYELPGIPPAGHSFVVLDDDPTGTQTSHGVPVITTWTAERIEDLLQHPVGFILTNSRSLTEKDAYQRVFEICSQIRKAAKQSGKKITVVTRTDSTLRGHFMAESNAVIDSLELQSPLRIFAPAFFEGGRYTIDNEHYVQEGENLIPASETPFAEDKTFGYHSGELYAYIQEKDPDLKGKEQIAALSVQEIRTLTVSDLASKISDYHQVKKHLIINACAPSDLNKTAAAIHEAQKQGLSLMIRSAAGIIPALGGIHPLPLLSGSTLREASNPNGGLIVVGSYVPKSTGQLNYLLENHDLVKIEVEASILAGDDSDAYISNLAEEVDDAMTSGKDCVIYTSRKLVSGASKEESLRIVNQVSNGLIAIVDLLQARPSFVIAKGGITSSDVATKALLIEKAEVMGQLLPGVPVWMSGESAKYPGLPYVIFPGNVGTPESLATAYQKIT